VGHRMLRKRGKKGIMEIRDKIWRVRGLVETQ
jgi:hypothetical protein